MLKPNTSRAGDASPLNQYVTVNVHHVLMSSLSPASGPIDLTSVIPGQRSPLMFDSSLQFKTPGLHDMLAVWQKKRDGRQFPRRADFGIRDLVKVLPQTGIVELVQGAAGPRFFVRLNGSALDHYFAPIMGQFVDEVVPPYFAERWTNVFMAPLTARTPMRGLSRTEFRDQLYLVGEILLLPLAEDGDTPSGVLYAVFHYGSNEVNDRRQKIYELLSEEHERYSRGVVTSTA